MVILVTGSSGFVGKSLITKLKKIGYDVIGLDSKPGENTDMIQDISKKFEINKPIEVIVHLAARLEHERCSKKEFFSSIFGTVYLRAQEELEARTTCVRED